MAVSININELNNLYDENNRNDIYYIALQLLMENNTHFLTTNDGNGDLYLESTDSVNNAKLQILFLMCWRGKLSGRNRSRFQFITELKVNCMMEK